MIMKITRIGRNGMRIKFTKPGEGVRFIAEMNERNACYESAAKLYREIGDTAAVERCEKYIQKLISP